MIFSQKFLTKSFSFARVRTGLPKFDFSKSKTLGLDHPFSESIHEQVYKKEKQTIITQKNITPQAKVVERKLKPIKRLELNKAFMIASGISLLPIISNTTILLYNDLFLGNFDIPYAKTALKWFSLSSAINSGLLLGSYISFTSPVYNELYIDKETEVIDEDTQPYFNMIPTFITFSSGIILLSTNLSFNAFVTIFAILSTSSLFSQFYVKRKFFTKRGKGLLLILAVVQFLLLYSILKNYNKWNKNIMNRNQMDLLKKAFESNDEDFIKVAESLETYIDENDLEFALKKHEI